VDADTGSNKGSGERGAGSGRPNPSTQWHQVARLAYLGIIAIATLSSLHLEPDLVDALERLSRALYLRVHTHDIVDIARNLALFAGWGCVWAVTSQDHDTRKTLRGATASGLAISVGAETVQLFSRFRHSSILDIGANTAGALAGAAAVLLAVHVARKYRVRGAYVGVPAYTFFGSYLTVAVLQAGIVTRAERRIGAYGNPLRRLANTVRQFEPSSITDLAVTDALWFMPLGAFGFAMLAELGWKRSHTVWATTAGGFAIALITEALRGPQGLELNAGAVVMHALGAAVGAVAAAWMIPMLANRMDERQRALTLATAYVTLLAVLAWQPFRPETGMGSVTDQLSLSALVPLRSYDFRGLLSVADIAITFFLFLPLGGLLAVWPLRLRGWLGYCLPGVYVAIATELLQLVIRDRYFSGTDLMVQCAGVVVGYVVLKLAGYGVAGEVVVER
jgi:glycopeptide antibiotics resistance protein